MNKDLFKILNSNKIIIFFTKNLEQKYVRSLLFTRIFFTLFFISPTKNNLPFKKTSFVNIFMINKR